MFSINQNLSLYIPHVFNNITDDRIRKIFMDQELGEVSRIDKVARVDKNGKNYNSVYIHFNSWTESTSVNNFQARVMNPEKNARIIYDDPWHWIVLENTGAKHDSGARKVCIDVEEEKQIEQSVKEPLHDIDANMELVSSDYVGELEQEIYRLAKEKDSFKYQLIELKQDMEVMEAELSYTRTKCAGYESTLSAQRAE